MKKVAVILFNLGGPIDGNAVEPFLFNLFHDRAIIRLPQPFRLLIAKFISSRRAPIAKAIYDKIGGGSPILKNTQAQAEALQKELAQKESETRYKTFISMRYWHPFAHETIRDVVDFAPDEIILLPLYPQYSTTTTDSSTKDWYKSARKAGLDVSSKLICCYPQQEGFVHALAEHIYIAYEGAEKHGHPRILFSAHGLPEKIARSGDPYQMQCGLTVEALRQELGIYDLDSVLCFQSRVGPLKWIGPSTEDEIRRAGRNRVPVVIAPIAFVSDHSETLVEIDIDYRELARKCGVPFFASARPVGTALPFIKGLADTIRDARASNKDCLSSTGARLCPPEFSACACRVER